MCDCYSENCWGCGKSVAVHLGDYSVSRGNVKVFCKERTCHRKALDILTGVHVPSARDRKDKRLKGTSLLKRWKSPWAGHIVFYDRGCLFLVDWPREIGQNK